MKASDQLQITIYLFIHVFIYTSFKRVVMYLLLWFFRTDWYRSYWELQWCIL